MTDGSEKRNHQFEFHDSHALKSAVIQVHLQVVCRFVENMASHLLTKYIT